MPNPEEMLTKAKLSTPALSRPLVFGDREQITELRGWERSLEALKDENPGGKPTREYSIEYTVARTRRATVWARTESEAVDLLEDADDVESIEEVREGPIVNGQPAVIDSDY